MESQPERLGFGVARNQKFTLDEEVVIVADIKATGVDDERIVTAHPCPHEDDFLIRTSDDEQRVPAVRVLVSPLWDAVRIDRSRGEWVTLDELLDANGVNYDGREIFRR